MSNWTEWTAAAFRGTSLGVDQWRVDAELVGVRVFGGLATAGPGVLRSPVSFAPTVRAALIQAQASAAIADAISTALWQAWKEWADGVTIPGLPWYPAFFAWPAPVAPPIPNVPTPLALCPSAGLEAMSPLRLAASIRDLLGDRARIPQPATAIDELARAFGAAFTQWVTGATVTLAFGAGTAAVAYPWVPVAPVVGTVVNNGRGCLAATIPFPSAPLLPVS